MKRFLIILALISAAQANHRVRRVVEGHGAALGQFPYLVSLQQRGLLSTKYSHICGGTIINERYIVTAAHCIDDEKLSSLSVWTGTNHLTKGGKRYYVENMKAHHKYKTKPTGLFASLIAVTSADDIALIQVHGNITFNTVTQAIPLISRSTKMPTHSKVTISGWGSINKYITIFTDNIQYFEAKLISMTHCKTLYTYLIDSLKLALTINDICTMAKKDQGICTGDSGSPVVYNNTLAGIVSRSGPICGIGVPDIHTKVSRYTTWIQKTMRYMNKHPYRIAKPKKKFYFS